MKPSAEASAALVRADILVLLREKRYEEALARLYQARSESPDSAELQKGIDQVKEFLIGAYAKRLGGLDQIARPIAPAAGRSPDIVLLSRYIDGTSTYGDLAEMCPLGRLRTLQVLMEMYPRPSVPAALAEPGVPYARPRSLEPAAKPALPAAFEPPSDEAPPDTARSVSAIRIEPRVEAIEPVRERLESPEDRRYRELFELGTAAFIQRRYDDAAAAFESCGELRPGDAAAAVMLRRVRRELASR
jgi:tetratricopeptide (TPR) repeat protein